MSRIEHLLTILAEECNEVAQRATKALRFGLHEVQPGQELDNAERLMRELEDLLGAYTVLRLDVGLRYPRDEAIAEKGAKIDDFLAYSERCGTVDK